MPLKAHLNDKPFYSWDLTEEHRGQPFKCPACNDDMIIVLPTQKIKHFRHRAGMVHGEGETMEHMQAKMWFVEELNKMGIKSDVEYVMKKDNNIHILDVFFEHNFFPIGIECQYSGISLLDFKSRNNFYGRKGIKCVWVLVIGDTYDPDRVVTQTNFEQFKEVSKIKKIEKEIIKFQRALYYLNVEGNTLWVAKWTPSSPTHSRFGVGQSKTLGHFSQYLVDIAFLLNQTRKRKITGSGEWTHDQACLSTNRVLDEILNQKELT